MTEPDIKQNTILTELTAQIVSAYVEKNPVSTAELPRLIADVHMSITGLHSGAASGVAETREPAVNPKRSVTRDAITCLECGKKFKSLKRHIQSNHDTTPEEYRERWNLRPDYPMVAPAYAEQRSTLAKKLGLGRKPKSKSRKK